MKTTTTHCPHCQTLMRLVAGSPDKWVCPKCDARFVARTKKASASSPGEQPSRLWLPLLLIPLVVLILVGTLIVVHQLRTGAETKPVADSSTPPLDSDNSDTPSHLLTPTDSGPEPTSPRSNPLTRREPSSNSPPPERINQAIDRGVAYLKARLSGDRPAKANPQQIRAMALAGLALLECGVPADDPVVRQIADQVRTSARQATPRPRTGPRRVKPQQPRTTLPLRITYDVSIAIWFLDRLGEAKDQELIRTLALQLIAAQTANGGWTYACPPLSEAEGRRLLRLLQEPPPSNSTQGVPPAVRFQPGRALTFVAGSDDNSLTQFAILGLWAARKHGVPVERSLSMVEQRFRLSQHTSGCWGYPGPGTNAARLRPGAKPITEGRVVRPDSMTCAGLLGLAVGRGLGDRSTSPGTESKDPAVTKALLYLAHSVGKKPATTPAPARRAGTRRLLGARSLGDLYYLWSLERMAVVYGLPTIAGVDWYGWGGTILVAAQNDDGSWSDAFPGVVDTCFALLFLKRTNVVKDLTTQLEMLGQIKDVSSDEIRKGLAPVAPEDPTEKEDAHSGEMTKELTPGSPGATLQPKAP